MSVANPKKSPPGRWSHEATVAFYERHHGDLFEMVRTIEGWYHVPASPHSIAAKIKDYVEGSTAWRSGEKRQTPEKNPPDKPYRFIQQEAFPLGWYKKMYGKAGEKYFKPGIWDRYGDPIKVGDAVMVHVHDDKDVRPGVIVKIDEGRFKEHYFVHVRLDESSAIVQMRPVRIEKIEKNPGDGANPKKSALSDSEKKAAIKIYSEFQKRRPDTIRVTHMKTPSALIRLGRADSIMYESDKWGKKPTLYKHTFESNDCEVYWDLKNKALVIRGSELEVTRRGIEG